MLTIYLCATPDDGCLVTCEMGYVSLDSFQASRSGIKVCDVMKGRLVCQQ